MSVLVVNTGSSSVKLSVIGADDETLASRDLEAPDGRVDVDAVAAAVEQLPDAAVAGHRVVHGGDETRPRVVDAALREHIDSLAMLAPLHQARALAGMDAVTRARPGLTSVACFDTAFHATLPAAARTYALPREWRDRHGLRRYGFHGLSHRWAARRALELAPGAQRIVSCHLGAGASLAAIADGRSVDTTMGFTPLEGIVMATRSGSVDPGLLTWLQHTAGMSAHELEDGLSHESGLLGLAGTADMRELLARDDADARLALDVYVHRLRAAVAAMAAALGGMDALVFTGGIGEHAAPIRARTVAGLGFLGAQVDPARNDAATSDTDVSASEGPVRTLVVTSREDLEIARQCRAAL